MGNTRSRITAVIEVVGVFILVALVFRAILASPLGEWESQSLRRHLVEYGLVLALPLVLLAVTRRGFKGYGISFLDLGYQLKVAAIGFIPIFVVSAMLHFVGWQGWGQALLVSAVEVVVLLVLAWLLRKKLAVGQMGALSILILPRAGFNLEAGAGDVVLGVVYSLVFVALGEEVLFRGYIQSRLNEAFGRPYRFFGVNWGWGVIIASLLFGLWHVLNPFNPFIGEFALAWQWGLWTFFLGLILGYVREKTSSVLASAILHGVINL